MGELQGRREPDRPEQPPADDAHPRPRVEIRNTPGPRPAPGPADVLNNPRTPRDHPEPAKRDTPDGPTHRPPDLIPPRGEDLAEKDAPGASLADRLRKRALERENLENQTSATEGWGHTFDAIASKPPGPTETHTEVRPRHTWIDTPRPGIDHGEALTAMLVTGILLGEGLRLGYRKASELKERWNARNR